MELRVTKTNGSDRTLTAPGVLRRESPGEADLWWPGGPTFAWINGDLDDPVQYAVPSGLVEIDGVRTANLDLSDPANTANAPIEYGCGRVFLVQGGDLPVVRGLPGWYTDGGYSSDQIPPTGLMQHTGEWGPMPDERDTKITGSGRLFASHVPGALACGLEWERGGTPYSGAAVVWVAQQWKRGCHLYRLTSGDEPTWWDADSDSDLLPYQGYGSLHGGPSTLYGAIRPDGVDWPRSGWGTCDPDHWSIDQSCLAAHLLDWPIAAAQARCNAETGLATARRETSTGGRGHGHLIRGFACFSMVDEARALQMVTEEVGRLEARNDTASGPFPFYDRGNSTDAYHLSPNDVQWIVDLLGYTNDQRKELAKSASAFMVGIVGCGCALAARAFAAHRVRERLFGQMELCAMFLHGPARELALDVDSRTYAMPGDGVAWDDVAPPRLDLKIRLADGGSKSVGPRFIVPALAAYYGFTGDERARSAALYYQTGYGVWGNWLETWPMGSL